MCDHDPYPRIACSAAVISNHEIAPMVFSLTISSQDILSPLSGQFFMLRSRPSGVLLGRPISVYHSNSETITFLILKKGKGTAELCALREGSFVDIVGLIGNSFEKPAELVKSGVVKETESALRVAIIGGGIGVAPVAGFALTLPALSFDFYASFRSLPYGLDLVESHAKKMTITSEDGCAGVKGMLPSVFDSSHYDLVYACGPTPMLRYVQKECCTPVPGKKMPLVFLSLEEHMACGAGACLGCTIRTTRGNRRCCVDGPVFNGSEVIF